MANRVYMKSSDMRRSFRDVLEHVIRGDEVVVEHYSRPVALISPYPQEVVEKKEALPPRKKLSVLTGTEDTSGARSSPINRARCLRNRKVHHMTPKERAELQRRTQEANRRAEQERRIREAARRR